MTKTWTSFSQGKQMKSFDDVLRELDLPASQLSGWVDNNWILPKAQSAGFLFSEEDIARARMLKELIVDIGANDAAIPVILRAMDQVYDLRKMMDRLSDVIANLSLDARQELQQALRDQQAERQAATTDEKQQHEHGYP